MQNKTRSPGLYILGLFVGLALGGFLLMPAAVITMSYLANVLNVNQKSGFYIIYAVTLSLGAGGIWLTVKRLDFLSGFITGAAVGLFGLTALCSTVY